MPDIDMIGGFAEDHPASEPFPVFVSTATGKEKNVLRMELIPVACWKLNDVRFGFGASFPLPASKSEFMALEELRREHPGAPLSVFGHADPVDDEGYNKTLSGRRAEAVYAVLTGDTGRLERLYKTAGESEGWGGECVRTMLGALGYEDTRSFQAGNGLSADGQAGPATRERLFGCYAAYLFPARLGKGEFLGKGADEGGKGAVQGCSEFNPVRVFSAEEDAEFKKAGKAEKRDEENGVNRRVVVLLFRPGSEIAAAKWPCPRVSEGVAGCKKRFWSNAAERRGPQAARREYAETKDTFGCRFYDRLTAVSPCERVRPLLRIRLHDSLGRTLPGAPYTLRYGGRESGGVADAEGFVTEPLDPSVELCQLRWADGEAAAWREMTVYTRLLAADGEDGLRRRLQNLGYPMEREAGFNLRCFQAHRGLQITGEADAATREKLAAIYLAARDDFEEPEEVAPATAPAGEQRT